MNNAFKKGKFSKWYGSRFYKSCIGPSLTYTRWLSMQPKSTIENIYGFAPTEKMLDLVSIQTL